MMDKQEKIKRLEEFKHMVLSWRSSRAADIRSKINQEKQWVRQEVIEAGCFKTITICPPPAIGGLVMRGVDLFDSMFDPPYRMDLSNGVVDMVDSTIGVLRMDSPPATETSTAPTVQSEITLNYAFVAMPMNTEDQSLVDVLDAIKEAGQRCGVQAERVDDLQSNDRITDRILESIRKAEFVIADLTNARPNVYFEAGYAHACMKTPIYIARDGTQLEFDLKDYPVIFFKNLKQLKDELEKRLRALADKRVTGRGDR